MSVTPVIVPYRPEHRAGLLALWTRFFGAWSAQRLERRWAWQYVENPYCAERRPVQLIAHVGDAVVGHMSGAPVPMRIDGRRTLALACSGLVVDDRHRWVGLRLTRALMHATPVLGRASGAALEQLLRSAGGSFIAASQQRFAFPRRRRARLALALRWRLPRAIGALATPAVVAPIAALWWPRDRPAARPLPRPPPDARSIRPLESFGADYDELWTRVRGRWRHTLDKDSAYMNWRYVRCPTLHAVRLGLVSAGGSLRAAAVGVRWAHQDRCHRACGSSAEIAEFIADDADDSGVEELLVRMMHDLDAHRVDEIGATGLHRSLHPLLQRVGFEREISDVFRIAIAVDSSTPVIAGDDWYSTAGDSDALYSSGL